MINITIDKDTQGYLLRLKNDIQLMQEQINTTIITYIRAKGFPSDIQYRVSEDFSQVQQIIPENAIANELQDMKEGLENLAGKAEKAKSEE